MLAILIAFLLAGILAVVFFIILSFDPRRQSLTKRKFIAYFNRLAAAYKLKFSKTELLDEIMIGFDSLEQKLLVLEKTPDGKPHPRLISLMDLKRCAVINYYGNVHRSGNRQELSIEKILLRFVFRDESIEDITFYSHETRNNKDISNLVEKARGWQNLLTTHQRQHYALI